VIDRKEFDMGAKHAPGPWRTTVDRIVKVEAHYPDEEDTLEHPWTRYRTIPTVPGMA